MSTDLIVVIMMDVLLQAAVGRLRIGSHRHATAAVCAIALCIVAGLLGAFLVAVVVTANVNLRVVTFKIAVGPQTAECQPCMTDSTGTHRL